MRRDQVEELVRSLASEICASLGLMLVDCTYRKSNAVWRILVRVDRASGVSIDDCAEVSRRLDAQLDELDPIEHHYTLEVSSAGLSGLLKTDADLERFIGRQIEVELNRPKREPGPAPGGRKAGAGDDRVVGRLLRFTQHALSIDTGQGVAEVQRGSVRRARPAVDFTGLGGHKGE